MKKFRLVGFYALGAAFMSSGAYAAAGLSTQQRLALLPFVALSIVLLNEAVLSWAASAGISKRVAYLLSLAGAISVAVVVRLVVGHSL